MTSKEKRFGLPGILEGTTASDAELMDQARAAVARKLGIDARSMVARKDQASADQGQEMDLYFEAPITVHKPTVVKDKFGNTPEEKAKMIHQHLTRPADPYAAARKQQALLKRQQAATQNESEKEATDFWNAYNDPSGKKMVAHINNMNKKYNESPDEEATQTKHDKPLAVIRQKMNENKNNKTVKQLTDLKNWSNNSKKT